jgi:Arc/MetJ-type ribon-helix-helix transcriptional regulator
MMQGQLAPARLPKKDQTMAVAFSPEIQRLIDQNMATGLYSSEEDVLQAALHVLSDYHATIADIRQGMIDYEQGRGEPLSQAMADIRRQLDAKL